MEMIYKITLHGMLQGRGATGILGGGICPPCTPPGLNPDITLQISQNSIFMDFTAYVVDQTFIMTAYVGQEVRAESVNPLPEVELIEDFIWRYSSHSSCKQWSN